MLKKLNWFDRLIIVIFILITVIAYFVLKSDPGKELRIEPKIEYSKTVTLKYKILFEGKEKHICDGLMNLDELFFYDTDDIAGKIVSKHIQPHYDEVLDKSTGKTRKIEHPELYDVIITINSVCEKNKNGTYKIGDIYVGLTKQITIKGKYVLLSGIVCSVEEVKNEKR